MDTKRFRLRSSNLEAYQDSENERIHLEFAEVDQNGKFFNEPMTISIRTVEPIQFNSADTYSLNMLVVSED